MCGLFLCALFLERAKVVPFKIVLQKESDFMPDSCHYGFPVLALVRQAALCPEVTYGMAQMELRR